MNDCDYFKWCIFAAEIGRVRREKYGQNCPQNFMFKFNFRRAPKCIPKKEKNLNLATL